MLERTGSRARSAAGRRRARIRSRLITRSRSPREAPGRGGSRLTGRVTAASERAVDLGPSIGRVSTRKPAERRQRAGTADAGELAEVAEEELEIPPVPKPHGGGRVLKATEEWWGEFWRSPISRLVDPRSDLRALSRLALLYDERDRALAAYKRKRSSLGSTGQLVVNPFAKEVASLDGRIAALEDRFGLTPKARLDLGVTYSEAHDALGELERRIEEAFADDQAPDDPRLRAVTVETTAEEKAG